MIISDKLMKNTGYTWHNLHRESVPVNLGAQHIFVKTSIYEWYSQLYRFEFLRFEDS